MQMNQNNQQQTQMRQSSQQQMSDEELQRTQVLNFDDFKKIARYEKISSKKPAIIVALLGALFIIIGSGYPIVQMQIEKSQQESTKTTVQARKKDIVERKSLSCVNTQSFGITGLNESLKIDYNFENDMLKSFTKELTLTNTENIELSQKHVQDYINALQGYLIQQDGYQVTVKQTDVGTITTTEVDYSTLNINSIPELNQGNVFFNVIYLANADYNAVKQDMESQNYICS